MSARTTKAARTAKAAESPAIRLPRPNAPRPARQAVRVRVGADPLIVRRWGGWFFVLAGLAAGGCAVVLALTLVQLDILPSSYPVLLVCFFAPLIPCALTIQTAAFDNAELLVTITYWMIAPVRRERIPYAAIRGIGTDYRTIHMTAGPPDFRFDLYLCMKCRRNYLLSSHYTESDYRSAVDRIRHHISFPILRFE